MSTICETPETKSDIPCLGVKLQELFIHVRENYTNDPVVPGDPITHNPWMNVPYDLVHCIREDLVSKVHSDNADNENLNVFDSRIKNTIENVLHAYIDGDDEGKKHAFEKAASEGKKANFELSDTAVVLVAYWIDLFVQTEILPAMGTTDIIQMFYPKVFIPMFERWNQMAPSHDDMDKNRTERRDISDILRGSRLHEKDKCYIGITYGDLFRRLRAVPYSVARDILLLAMNANKERGRVPRTRPAALATDSTGAKEITVGGISNAINKNLPSPRLLNLGPVLNMERASRKLQLESKNLGSLEVYPLQYILVGTAIVAALVGFCIGRHR